MLPSPGATSWTVSSRVTVLGSQPFIVAPHRRAGDAAVGPPSGGAENLAGPTDRLVRETKGPVRCYGVSGGRRRGAGARRRRCDRDRTVLDDVEERLGFRAFFAKHAWLDLTYRVVVGVLGGAIVVSGSSSSRCPARGG